MITIIGICLVAVCQMQGAGITHFSTATDTIRRDTITTLLPGVKVVSENASKGLNSSTPYYQINEESIKNAGITDVSDAMRRLPGVNLRDYGGAGGMKTVSVRGLGSEHTAVVYDGVTLSDCQNGQIDLARYSIDNISQISLYSGDNDDIFIPARAAASASSLYLSSFTAPGFDEGRTHLTAQMKVGSFGYYNPYLRFSGGNGRGLSFSGNAEYIHSDNDYPFTLVNGNLKTRERRENSKMNSWNGELNGRLRLKNGHTFTAKLYYYDNARDLPGPVIYYVSKSEESLRDRNFFAQMQYRGRISSLFSLAATGKFNWSATRYKDVNEKYPGGILDDYYIQRESYFSGSLLYVPTSRISMDYSADWAWNNLSSNSPKSIDPYRHSVLQTIAVKWKWWRATLMARGLYSLYINKAKSGDAGKNQSRLSPSVSLSVKPIDDASFFVRASYKNIFRVATFNELYFDHYGSINLNPEVTDQFNVGFTYSLPSQSWISEMTLTCDGYINHVKNKIVAVPFNMFIWIMTNLGKVRVYGLDMTLNTSFEIASEQSLLLSGNWSYQRAQPRTNRESAEWNRQVAYIPLNSGSLALTWKNPWVNTVIHATGCSARYTTNYNLPETKIEGYEDFGAAIFRKFEFKRNSFEIRFDLLNLFDRQYEIVARYPMPGRSWKLSAVFEI